MPDTTHSQAVEPIICNALNKAGRRCEQIARADGTGRCGYHQDRARYPDYDDTSPAAMALAGMNLDDGDLSVPGDALERAEYAAETTPDPPAAPAPGQADVPPVGHRWAFVYDEAQDDYVKKLVPEDDGPPPISVNEADVYHDEFEIGPEYAQGDHARFDYRWINASERHNLVDRRNGFVPVRNAANRRHAIRGGVVTNGDLILARRPKELTAARAQEQADRHARLTGEEVERFSEEARRAGSSAFGDIRTSQGAFAADAADVPAPRLAQPRPNGKRTFQINAPFQRDKLAERLASVGGDPQKP